MALIKRMFCESVEGLRVGKFNIANNSTAVIYKIGNTVIDTGPPNQWRVVKRIISEIKPEKVFLTHHHEDHSGNGAKIARCFDIPVYIHSFGVKPAKAGFSLKMYQKIFWGKPEKFEPETLDNEIDAGNGIVFKSIHTPGHSPDHVCFLEEEKGWLFSGDLFLSTRPNLFREDENLEEEIISLKKILKFDFRTVFCAHKGIVNKGHGAIAKKLDYFLSLVQEVKYLNGKGISIKDITRKLFGSKKDAAAVVSFNHICRENLVKQCLELD